MLNHQLIIKTYPPPIIGDTTKQLELFHYPTALYLSMGYYTIRILPASQYMTMVVTEFVKFKYHFLYMGVCALVYICHYQLDKLLGDIEGFRTYIYGILFLSK